MHEPAVLTDPWWDLRAGGPDECEQREALHAELLTEVAAGHPLHGQPIVVIARSEASDDILVDLADGRWALVHLTWKGAAEAPPWPLTKIYHGVHDLERHLHESK